MEPSIALPLSYDSSGTSKDEIKERFAQTMDFVEEYLRDVVCQRFPFSDKEKNKLTFEVIPGMGVGGLPMACQWARVRLNLF